MTFDKEINETNKTKEFFLTSLTRSSFTVRIPSNVGITNQAVFCLASELRTVLFHHFLGVHANRIRIRSQSLTQSPD